MGLTQNGILSIFKAYGALLTNDHFIYASGMHGHQYVNKDALFAHPPAISMLSREIAERFSDLGIETVVGPALGGIILSQWTAYHLSRIMMREVYAVFAEKQDKKFYFGRGYDAQICGRHVLVVEDVITKGDSARAVIEAVRNVGGSAESLGVLWNRGGLLKNDFGVFRLSALISFSLEAWPAEDCPLCKNGIPVNRYIGRGKELQKSV